MKIKESQIQTAIEHYLRLQENKGNLVYIKNNSGSMKKDKYYVRFGKQGSSDFLVFLRGDTIFLEVKTPKGRQSEYQKKFQGMVENQGFVYTIARSIHDCVDYIESLLEMN